MKIAKHNLVTLLLISFSTIFFSNAWAQCPSNMISYWKLQESTGPDYVDFYDSHDASAPTSAPSQTTGVSGKGQYFNASLSTFLTIDDHTDFDWSGTASFSIELWVKYTQTGSIRVFIGRDDPSNSTQWWIGQEATGEITWYLIDNNGGANSYLTTSSLYNTGQWVHIVAVRDGSTDVNSLYVNAGTPQTSTVNYDGNFASTAPISFGYLSVNSVPGYYYTGGLDEVAVYSRALGSSEITTHYNNARLYQIGYCDGNSPVFLSEPDIYANVGQEYTYDADASGNPLPVYSLVEHPDGMIVGAVTGEISWTPASASANGHVVLRATNTAGYTEQEFNVYVAEEPDCRDNMIAYWDFDDAGTPYYDNIAGYELTGTAITPATGKVGGALSFNGTSDSLSMKDTFGEYPDNVFFDFHDSFSIEAWIKTDATPSGVMVITGRDNTPINETHYWLGVDNTDGSAWFNLIDYAGNQKDIKGGYVLDNAWHHIVATYNASTNDMELWVDNSMVDNDNQNFGDFGGGANLNIGHLDREGSSDHFWFDGIIDELAFYDVALGASRVAENYNAGNSGDGACVYNYAPIILTSPDEEVDEDSPYYYQISATDIDPGDVLSISAPTKPAWLNFSYTPGETTAVLSATPTNANVGFHDVLLRVSDGSINVDQDFTIEVINVNDDPYFTSTPVTDATEDQEYVYKATADDDDVGDEVEITAVTIPSWLEFRNDSLIGKPEDPEVGTHPVTLRVSDGTATVDQNFTIEVENTNDPPVITSVPSETAAVGVEYIYHITATDVDEDDVLTFSEVYTPDWLNFNAGDAILSGTPTEDDLGENVVILKVNDGTVDVHQNYNIMVSLTALNNHQSDNGLLVFPNPADNEIHFEFYNNGSKRIVIYDMTGNILRDILSDQLKKVDVNISELRQGIYIYKVFYNDQIITGKFTKKQ